ncbi:leucine rich adaptor protein 1 [Austrofundulus limnaeus]|uniref:Leucine rich adaptor protein 1 n=1 Tax=Austrofundulus limnaeus TaxID=52670 RepID=A0A2I4BNH5_AUSLI|nr:PREDICTED: leucine rich adaptor protein 1-like [Austrofundulus limnaeus]
MAEEILNFPFPDLYELENKIGRKTPESLLTWMKDATGCEDTRSSDGSFHFSSSLSEKLSELKQEMTRLRSADVRILRQLVAVHEGIEAMHWLMEERGGMIGLLEEDDEELGLCMSPYRDSPSPSPSLSPASPESLSETISENPVDKTSANSYNSSLFESLEAGPSSLCSFSCETSGSVHDPQVEPVTDAVIPISDEVAESLKRMPDPARLRNIKSGAETIKRALLRCSKLRRQTKAEKTRLTPVLGRKNTEESFDSTEKDQSSACGTDPSLTYNSQWSWMQSKDDVTNL